MYIGKNDSTCRLCKESCQRTKGNTTGLWLHLQSNHNQLYTKLQDSKKPKPQTSVQTKLSDHNTYPTGSKEHKDFVRQIVIFIVTGFHSFRIVDEPQFRILLSNLNKRFVVPSSQTIRTTAFEACYKDTVEEMCEIFAKLPPRTLIHLTTDGWNSNDKFKSKYNSLTATFYEEHNESYRTLVLGISPSTTSNTAEFILAELVQIMERYRIQTGHFEFTLTTDTASVMKKLAKLTNTDIYNGWFKVSHWFGCIGHRLHLAITRGQKGTTIYEAVAKAREFTSKYSRNSSLRSDLSSLTGKAIIHAPDNRWYYHVFEIERILELRNEVKLVSRSYGMCFDDADFELMEMYINAVAPMKIACEKLSKKSATIDLVIPTIDTILFDLQKSLTTLNEDGQQLVNNIIGEIDRIMNLSDLKNDRFVALATFLNPAFKDLYIDSNDQIECWLQNEEAVESPLPSEFTEIIESEVDERRKILLQQNASKKSKMEKTGSKLSNQINSYVNQPITQKYVIVDPLEYWKKHKELYPELAKMFFALNSRPSTQVESERLFSAAGLLLDEKRSNLDPEKAEKYLILNKFYK